MGSCCCPFLSNFLNYSHSYGNWMYNNYCKPNIAHTELFTMNISVAGKVKTISLRCYRHSMDGTVLGLLYTISVDDS